MPVSPRINKIVLIFMTAVLWLQDQNKTSLKRIANFFDEQDKTRGELNIIVVFKFGFNLIQTNFIKVLESP